MRLGTFSFLKNSRLKTLCQCFSRRLSAVPAELVKPAGDPSLVEVSPSWEESEEPELRTMVLRDMQVFPDFVSETEETALLDELEPYLKRMRYEFDHWDNAIQGYRETERGAWLACNEAVVARVRSHAFAGARTPALPHAHVLDLAPAGHIKPHVDAIRFCGSVIAGLSLCSAAVMRLQHSERPQFQLTALLPRRSLYVMKDVARYAFSHAVLGSEESMWRGERVPRRRRLAVICRTQPERLPDSLATE